MTDGVQGDYGRVHILPHEGGTNPINGVHGGVVQLVRFRAHNPTSRGWKVTWQEDHQSLYWTIPGHCGGIYAARLGDPLHIPWLNQSTSSSGGDQGGFGEEPARPKLLKE
jgi:hypothetical protein